MEEKNYGNPLTDKDLETVAGGEDLYPTGHGETTSFAGNEKPLRDPHLGLVIDPKHYEERHWTPIANK